MGARSVKRATLGLAVLCILTGVLPAGASHNACHDEGFGDDVFVDTGVAFAGADTGLNDGWMRACLDVLGVGGTTAVRRQGSQSHALLGRCTLLPPNCLPVGPIAGALGGGAGLDDVGNPFVVQAVPPPAGASALQLSFFPPEPCSFPALAGSTATWFGTALWPGLEARRVPGGLTTATLTHGFVMFRIGAAGIVQTGVGGPPPAPTLTFANGGTATRQYALPGFGVAMLDPGPPCGMLNWAVVI